MNCFAPAPNKSQSFIAANRPIHRVCAVINADELVWGHRGNGDFPIAEYNALRDCFRFTEKREL
jgi:hypothetical protein